MVEHELEQALLDGAGAGFALTAAVAVLVHTMLPDMPWGAAIALGAIVAPPDAAAATAIPASARSWAALPSRTPTASS